MVYFMENPNLKWMITRGIILGNFYIEALKKIKNKCFYDGNYIDDVLFSIISKVSNWSSPLWGVAIHTFIHVSGWTFQLCGMSRVHNVVTPLKCTSYP